MATQIQFRRGSAAEHTAFTGALGEITVNTTNDSLHVHDASTAGGYEQARADLSNHSNVGILTAVTFSGNLEGTVSGSIVGNINSSGVSTFFSINSENISNTGIVTVSQDLYVDRNLKVAGVSTFVGNVTFEGGTINLGDSSSDTINVLGDFGSNLNPDISGTYDFGNINKKWRNAEFTGIITANTFVGNITGGVTGNAATATALQTPRTFSITGDVVSSAISFDGTGNVSLAATIQPNSVALGSDTTGNYVETISGTNGEIEVSGSGSETASVTIGLPNYVDISSGLVVAGVTTSTTFDGNLTGNVTGALTGNAATATNATNSTNVAITDNTATNASYYIHFGSATSGNDGVEVDSTGLTYNPSSNTLSTGNFNSTSDINLKKDIEVIANPNELLKEINGVRFAWKVNDRKSTGVIAQDVEKVLPELVDTSDNGNKTVNYQGLIGVLIEAVKDQQKQINALKEEIELLKQ